MKFTAAIFFLLISFLTVQPLFSSQVTAKEGSACCKKMDAAKKNSCNRSSSKPSGDCEHCNPFMACSSCNFFKPDNHFQLSIPLELPNKNINFLRQTYHSSYLADCWHPPEPLS